MAEGDEKRTLIETYLPVEEISDEAKKEKLGLAKPRTFEMHFWWTRKPLITARAVVLGSLLSSDYDYQKFIRLIGLNREKRSHNYDISDEGIKELKFDIKKNWDTFPTIIDPFSGGGSIPFETMRYGFDVVANDYNPVAYLIEKATLDYPRKYGKKIYSDVETAFQWIFSETKKELEYLYPKYGNNDPIAYIWAWAVSCPECGFKNPLVGQWVLSRKFGKEYYIHYDILHNNGNQLIISIEKGKNPQEPNCSSGKGKCLNCGAIIPKDIIQKDIRDNKDEILLAVVHRGRSSKEYSIPQKEDYIAIENARKIVKNNWESWIQQELIPIEEIPKDTRGSLSSKIYLQYWYNLLNERQKILFVTLLKNIRKYLNENLKVQDNEYRNAIATYLSLIFGKHIDYNCRSASWHRSYEVISSTLGKRGVGMMWDHVEVNPFIQGSGTLLSAIKSILDGIQYSIEKLDNRGNCIVTQKSILKIDPHHYNLIITDPPYFDDVRYAEFSNFFYSWERLALKSFIDIGDVPTAEELSVGGWGRTSEFFSRLFLLTSKKIHSLLSDNGLLVMFFAHSSVEAWDFVINALRRSGFRITATWPIHTESTENPLARGNASIMSSIIIVARKRKQEKSGYIEEIHEELQNHLSRRLDEFWEYGLRGADLTVASMGVTLDIITQYSEIKSYTGEMTIKDVLELVQDSVTHYVLQRYMKNAESLDAPTAFYLYTRFSGLEGMPFDTANLIAKSMKIDLKVLEKEHLIESVKSKKTSGVKIQTFKDREDLYRRTIPMSSMINAVHYMMAAFAHGGYDEVQQVLSTIPYGRNEIRDILEAFQSLPPGDPERQIAQQILERMGTHFPKTGQQSLDKY